MRNERVQALTRFREQVGAKFFPASAECGLRFKVEAFQTRLAENGTRLLERGAHTQNGVLDQAKVAFTQWGLSMRP